MERPTDKTNTATAQALTTPSGSKSDLSYGDIMGIMGEVVKGKTQSETEEIMAAFQKTHDLLDTFNDIQKEGVIKILSKIMKASGAFDS